MAQVSNVEESLKQLYLQQGRLLADYPWE